MFRYMFRHMLKHMFRHMLERAAAGTKTCATSMIRKSDSTMDNFTYCAPTRILFGKGTIPAIAPHISAFGVQRLLLVFGGGSARQNGVYEALTTALRDVGIVWDEFWGVKPNPSLEQVNAGIAKARAFGAQGVLAVGGGSVIDCGKAIAAGVHLDDYWTFVETRKPAENALPVFAVLTLSGTSSEMNDKAVITNEAEAKKWSIGGQCMAPKVTAIDPQVQATLPWSLTASSGIDAMTHVMENYFRGRPGTDGTGRTDGTGEIGGTGFFREETQLQINEALLRSIVLSLNALQKDSASYDARANLAWAACWGLNGMSAAGLSSGDWTSHALEHALSGLFPHIPHGAGLAVLFPSWMEEVYPFAPDIFARFARNIWGIAFDPANPAAVLEAAQQGVAATRAAFSGWGAPDNLSHWGVREEHIPVMVQNAYSYRALGRLVPLNEEQVTRIYKRVL